MPGGLGHYMLPYEKWLPMSCRDLLIFMLNAFNYLINALCSSHVLWLPLPGDQLVLHTDV